MNIRIQRQIIKEEDLKRSEQILIDNGIEKDEVNIVMQAIGYALIDTELYLEED